MKLFCLLCCVYWCIVVLTDAYLTHLSDKYHRHRSSKSIQISSILWFITWPIMLGYLFINLFRKESKND